MISLANLVGVVGTITNFGFGTLALKDIAKSSNSQTSLFYTISMYRILSYATGGLGFLLLLVFPKLLSQFIFGALDYWLLILVLSGMPLFAQINTFYFTILQGTRLFMKISLSNALSGIIVLCVTFIMFFYFKGKGIVYVIMSTALVPLMVNSFFVKKLKLKKVEISFRSFLTKGRELMFSGASIALSKVSPLLTVLLINAFLIKSGRLEHVGLYGAASAILANVTGILFVTMQGEFFSRISAHAGSLRNTSFHASVQIDFLMAVLSPILVMLIPLTKFAIQTLYSNDFHEATLIVQLGCVAMALKAFSWPLCFVYLTQNRNRQFLFYEVITNVALLLSAIVFYRYISLSGLGVALIFSNIAGGIFVYWSLKKTLGFNFYKRTMLRYSWYLVLVMLSTFSSIIYIRMEGMIILNLIVIILTFYSSLKFLGKKLGLKVFL